MPRVVTVDGVEGVNLVDPQLDGLWLLAHADIAQLHLSFWVLIHHKFELVSDDLLDWRTFESCKPASLYELVEATPVRVDVSDISVRCGGLVDVEWGQAEGLLDRVALLDRDSVLLFDPVVVDLEVMGLSRLRHAQIHGVRIEVYILLHLRALEVLRLLELVNRVKPPVVHELSHLSVFSLVFLQELAPVSSHCVFEPYPSALGVARALQELAELDQLLVRLL